MATIIKTDGTRMEVQPENGTDFQLDELQKIVGGYIEIISNWEGDTIMVINEEGKCDGLPFNLVATEVAVAQRMISVYDVIVGDALVCKSNEVR